MSKGIDLEKGNPKPKGKQTLLGVLHHVLNQMFINIGDTVQFSYSCNPKDLNPNNILHFPLDFHLIVSKLPDLDR